MLSTAASSSDDSRCPVGYCVSRQLRYVDKSRLPRIKSGKESLSPFLRHHRPWLHYAARGDGSGGLLALPQRACLSCGCRECGARSCCARLDNVMMERAEGYLDVGERASSEQRSVCQSSSLSTADPKPLGSVVPMSMTLVVGSLQQPVEWRVVAIAPCYAVACVR